ncbi:Cilia- and flagella-associated protein 91 [Lobulomyces angularis]|nr:Cilia- and flagella-associated protein 91 [Lobulomyces angularis]
MIFNRLSIFVDYNHEEEQSLLPDINVQNNALVVKKSSFIDFIQSEIIYLATFSVHAIQQIKSGLSHHKVITLDPERSDWRLDHTIMSKCFQGLLDFNGHSIARTRFLQTLIPKVLPWNVYVVPFSFHVNLETLLVEENKVKAKNPRLFSTHYILPDEINAKNEFTLSGEWVSWGKLDNVQEKKKVILYLHGGAYFAGSTKTHRQLVWRYAKESGAKIFVVNYRLAPENPFPAQLHDAYACFLYLTNPGHPAFKSSGFFSSNYPLHNPIAPSDITLMGDSAGGGLCMSLLSYLKNYLSIPSVADYLVSKDECKQSSCSLLPKTLPNGAVLLSPWLDLTCSMESWKTNASTDYLFRMEFFSDIHHVGSKNPVYWYTYGEEKLFGKDYLNWGRKWFMDKEFKKDDLHVLELTSKVVSHPLVSPYFLDHENLQGFCPILIQAGDAEVLRDESLFMAHKLFVANSALNKEGLIRHELYRHMPHVFPAFVWLETSIVSIKSVGKFIRKLNNEKNSNLIDAVDGIFSINKFEDRYSLPYANAKSGLLLERVDSSLVTESIFNLYMTTLHHNATANRAHDYLYALDSNFTVSCAKDHYKQISKAKTHDAVIHPIYPNMFSSLQNYPQCQYEFKQRVVADIGNDRRVFNKGAPNCFVDSNSGAIIFNNNTANVSGENRFRYFKRPIIPYQPSMGGTIVYAKKPIKKVDSDSGKERAASPLFRSSHVQTVFRESFSQTEPYSPEYIISSSSKATPELLALATLTYGAGLPVGQQELEMIERARLKRAWEASLPKVVDQKSFEKRLKMMEEMELKEWIERDEEIKRIQEARLVVLEKVIRKREAENECINAERIEKIWQRKLQDRNACMDRIQAKRIKALRKLSEKREQVGIDFQRRDIIQEYADFGSKIYAPKTRDGVFKDRTVTTLCVQISQLKEHLGIEQLEAQIPDSIFLPDINQPSVKKSFVTKVRMDQQMQQQLNLMDLRLKEKKMLHLESKKRPQETQLKFSQKIQKSPIRPPFPIIPETAEDEIRKEENAIFLQKLIRGIIVQNFMYQGKQRRLSLINELKMRYKIEQGLVKLKEFEKKNTLEEEDEHSFKNSDSFVEGENGHAQGNLNSDKIVHEIEDQEFSFHIDSHAKNEDNFKIKPLSARKAIQSNLQSEYIAKTFDFLTKELTRLRQEKVIAAVVRLAERTRRLREAEERGCREEEIKRRDIEDQVFKQLISVNQETVESFLETIVEDSISHTSKVQARIKVRDYAAKINDVVDGLEKRKEKGENIIDNTVQDLVSSFLIPEVEKNCLREKVKLNQKRFLLAAHRTVYSQQPAIEQNLADLKEKQDSLRIEQSKSNRKMLSKGNSSISMAKIGSKSSRKIEDINDE